MISEECFKYSPSFYHRADAYHSTKLYDHSASSSSGVAIKSMHLKVHLGLDLTVAEINIKQYEIKSFKNVIRCTDGMPKSMHTR